MIGIITIYGLVCYFIGILIGNRFPLKEKEICICAAVIAEDGTIYRGHRHGDAMLVCRDHDKKLKDSTNAQGFITSKNRYVTRTEGRILQYMAGIKSADAEGYRGNTLFSEDLY